MEFPYEIFSSFKFDIPAKLYRQKKRFIYLWEKVDVKSTFLQSGVTKKFYTTLEIEFF